MHHVVAVPEFDDLRALVKVGSGGRAIVVTIVVVVEHGVEGRRDDRDGVAMFAVVLDEQVLLIFERFVEELAQHHDPHFRVLLGPSPGLKK